MLYFAGQNCDKVPERYGDDNSVVQWLYSSSSRMKRADFIQACSYEVIVSRDDCV